MNALAEHIRPRRLPDSPGCANHGATGTGSGRRTSSGPRRAAIIAGITQVDHRATFDRFRALVYVAGLSAGGAMATVMAAINRICIDAGPRSSGLGDQAFTYTPGRPSAPWQSGGQPAPSGDVPPRVPWWADTTVHRSTPTKIVAAPLDVERTATTSPTKQPPPAARTPFPYSRSRATPTGHGTVWLRPNLDRGQGGGHAWFGGDPQELHSPNVQCLCPDDPLLPRASSGIVTAAA